MIQTGHFQINVAALDGQLQNTLDMLPLFQFGIFVRMLCVMAELKPEAGNMQIFFRTIVTIRFMRLPSLIILWSILAHGIQTIKWYFAFRVVKFVNKS
jgi:hypothetical protein